jgi:hypothetical protein
VPENAFNDLLDGFIDGFDKGDAVHDIIVKGEQRLEGEHAAKKSKANCEKDQKDQKQDLHNEVDGALIVLEKGERLQKMLDKADEGLR